MLSFLNKKFIRNKAFRSVCNKFTDTLCAKDKSNKSGQVAVVLILTIAIALVFYAVSLNVSQFQREKTQVTIASNQAASLLASQMASYGQSVLMQQLGGRLRRCGWTGVFLLIIVIVVIIILIIIIIITVGTAAPAAGGAAAAAGGAGATIGGLATGTLVVLGLAAGAAVAALAIQLAYIEPKLTSMWNRVIAAKLTLTNQFLENGMQAALQGIVTDQKFVPDILDLDADGVYGFNGDEPRDRIGRYSYYYTKQRIETIVEGDELSVQDFIGDLQEFIFEDPEGSGADNNFGLYDPLPTGDECSTGGFHPCCYDLDSNPVVPSECNPCCVPDTVVSPFNDEAVQIRPSCCDCFTEGTCDNEYEQCGSAATCDHSVMSPYGAASLNGNNYKYVFQPFGDNRGNLFRSFREQIGIDDEHPLYFKEPTLDGQFPEGIPIFPSLAQTPHVAGESGFRLEDATGYYIPPIFNPPDYFEDRRGVFPFFHKIKDPDGWGIELATLDPGLAAGENPAHCYWVDIAFHPECDPGGGDVAIPEELRRSVITGNPVDPEDEALDLPNDPAEEIEPIGIFLQFNTSTEVDDMNDNVSGNPPLATDRIEFPQGIIAESTECAYLAFAPGAAADLGFWKPGSDMFCNSGDPIPEDGNSGWPYFQGCAKFGTDCTDGFCVDPDEDYPCTVSGVACVDPQEASPCTESGFDTFTRPCFCDEGADPTLWNDDVLDLMTFDLEEFIALSYDLFELGNCDLSQFADCNRLEDAFLDLEFWYDNFAEWIEGGTALAADGGSEAVYLGDGVIAPACFTCNEQDGRLWQMRDEMIAMRDRLSDWRNSDNQGGDCEEVWCVPSLEADDTECDLVPPAEAATFDINLNGIRGDLEDIVACLDFNVEGVDAEAAAAFSTCLTDCSLANCGLEIEDIGLGVPGPLPQYHAITEAPYPYPAAVFNPAFCNVVWQPGEPIPNPWYQAIVDNLQRALGQSFTYDFYGEAAFQTCLDLCNHDNCAQESQTPEGNLPLTHSITGVPYTYPGDFDAAAECPTWGPGNAYYDQIQTNYNTAAVILGTEGLNMGNNFRFAECRANCSEAACGNLPRSQIPPGATGFDPNSPPGGDFAPSSSAQDHLASFLNCFDNCNTTTCCYDTSCANPPLPTTDPALNPYEYPVDGLGNPIPIDPANDCPDGRLVRNAGSGGVGPGPLDWYEAITEAMIQAYPACDLTDGASLDPENTADNGWLLNIEVSAIEAENQVAKFEQRRNFLRQRLAEVDNMITIFDDAQQQFDDFITDAQDLIQARIAYHEGEIGLPDTVIYGWKDEPDEDTGEEGKWHIIKVQAKTPVGRCDNRCGIGGGPDPGWPRVRTYTRGGIERCYKLVNHAGLVKVRVTRWDEKDPPGTVLKFPNGETIWQFRQDRPDKTPFRSTDILENVCGDLSLPDEAWAGIPGIPEYAGGIYREAFLMNRYQSGLNEDCWNLANQILTKGVVSETCAAYGYRGRANVNFTFVDCGPLPF